jgi:anti-anti-sigma factor
MSDLHVQVEELPSPKKVALVVLRGSIDAKTVFVFQSKLNAVIERGFRRFIIDMEQVKYVNSTGLGYMINLSDSITVESGEVMLVQVQPKVKMVFEMLGLNDFFKVFDSREEALAWVDRSESGPAPAAESAGSATVKGRLPEALAAGGPETVVLKARPPPEPDTALVRKDKASSTAVLKGGVPRPAVPEHEAPPAAPAIPSAPTPRPEDLAIPCPVCTMPLTLAGGGSYRCPRCMAVFQFDGSGVTQVVPRRRGAPVQLSMDCTPESIDGLSGFVEAVARRAGFSEEERLRLRDVVKSCIEDVKRYSYNGDQDNMVHVLMVGAEGRLEVRLADTGKAVPPASEAAAGKPDGAGPFAAARQYMDQFHLTHHPRGGNVVTLVKRKS